MTSARLVLHDVCGPLNDLLGKLDSDQGEKWLSRLKRLLRRENPYHTTSVHGAFIVEVDYDVLWAKQVVHAQICWVVDHEELGLRAEPYHRSADALCVGKVARSIIVLHLDYYESNDQVIAEMKRLNLRPTTSHETLAFAAVLPNQLPTHSFLGLGSMWENSFGGRFFPCLERQDNSAEVGVRLRWWLDARKGNELFLCVPCPEKVASDQDRS